MKTTLLRSASVSLLLGACSPSTTPRAPATANEKAPAPAATTAPAEAPRDLSAMLARELDALPALSPIAGRGWSTKVPGRKVHVKPGTSEGSEVIVFEFENSAAVDCVIFPEAIDPASYIATILNELKKSIEIVGYTPTRVAVEKEMPAYFASVRYQKKTPQGLLGGQLKLAFGLHAARPMMCLHDVPGFTATFESVARAVFAHYQVDDYVPPVAVEIGVARVGTMPIGFTRASTQLLEAGRTQYVTISAQIVPRSANELMVSDEAEVVVASRTKIEEAHFIQGDARGEKMNLELKALKNGKYQVSGTLDSKTTEATFSTKGGLPSPEATSRRLKQQLDTKKVFRFTQTEYHPSLDPTTTVEVSYSRTNSDPERLVHIGLGQLEVLATLDEAGEQQKYEMKAGSQSVVFERLYQRDDRKAGKDAAAGKQKAATAATAGKAATATSATGAAKATENERP